MSSLSVCSCGKGVVLWKTQIVSLRVFVRKVWLYSLDIMIMSDPKAGDLANMYMTMIQGMCLACDRSLRNAPHRRRRYEKKFGRDENTGMPRCLMAAKFRTDRDPTGEMTLKHWISTGQIQELPPPLSLERCRVPRIFSTSWIVGLVN